MADTPETSEYISIQKRIKAAKKGNIPANLLRFQVPEVKQQKPGLPCVLKDYIERVEWPGRAG
mgnify:CR=1 FL=1